MFFKLRRFWSRRRKDDAPTDYIETETGVSRGALGAALPPNLIAKWDAPAGQAAIKDYDADGINNFLGVVGGMHEEMQALLARVEESFTHRRSRALETLRAIRAALSGRVATCTANPSHNVVSAPLDDAERDIRAELADFSAHHRSLVVSEFEAQHARAVFLERHPRVDRSRQPPDSIGPKVGWIVAAMLCEIIWNGLFFKSSSSHGLVGAVIDFIVIAPINVILAVVIGSCTWRYMSHSYLALRVFGVVGTASLITLIFFYHIYFTAVRVSVHSPLHPDVGNNFRTLLSLDALNVVDYNSLGIFLFGIIFAGFAAYKAYGLFHPYPGFGPGALRFEKARAIVWGHERAAVGAVRSIGRRGDIQFAEAINTWTADVQKARRMYDGMREDVRALRDTVDRLQSAHALGLREIRASYSKYAALVSRVPSEEDMPTLKAAGFESSTKEAEKLRDECSNFAAELKTKVHAYQHQLNVLIADNVDKGSALAKEVRTSVATGGIVQPMPQRSRTAAATTAAGTTV